MFCMLHTAAAGRRVFFDSAAHSTRSCASFVPIRDTRQKSRHVAAEAVPLCIGVLQHLLLRERVQESLAVLAAAMPEVGLIDRPCSQGPIRPRNSMSLCRRTDNHRSVNEMPPGSLGSSTTSPASSSNLGAGGAGGMVCWLGYVGGARPTAAGVIGVKWFTPVCDMLMSLLIPKSACGAHPTTH